jgi:hypothetical protein
VAKGRNLSHHECNRDLSTVIEQRLLFDKKLHYIRRMNSSVWESRFRWLGRLGIAALIGLVILMPVLLFWAAPHPVIGIGVLLFVPGAIYLIVVTVWHRKERYRGKHSDLWGGLILLETTGWFKILYLFRHIIPDARRTGRQAGLKRSTGA